ncbi:hypothetical protein BJX68DRAFT_222962 [Aspergillus pseudodeflectus]|uniref:Uncharacterized protein n=1 Tax=Aspergillus pseudodeflectus TaxID=176178 RepID=A0ABR4LAR1_9EURO
MYVDSGIHKLALSNLEWIFTNSKHGYSEDYPRLLLKPSTFSVSLPNRDLPQWLQLSASDIPCPLPTESGIDESPDISLECG